LKIAAKSHQICLFDILSLKNDYLVFIGFVLVINRFSVFRKPIMPIILMFRVIGKKHQIK